MTIALYVNIAVALLLVPTLIYSVLLNRRLSALRSNRAELEALIQQFNESCTRAEAGVRSLRTATDEAVRLQQYLERSQTLRDDLSYLLDRGGNLADRLEGGVRSARSESKLRAVPNIAAVADEEPAPRPVAAPTRLADRLAERQAAEEGNAAEAPAERPARASRMERAGRERPDRAALRQALAGTAPAAGDAGEGSPRSKAERELLQALRSRR